jgi:hypothetical protein
MGRIQAECFICGLDFFQDEMVRHYRYGRLVDVKCADELTHTDYMGLLERPEEHTQHSEQPVAFQGEQPTPPAEWYTARWYIDKWGMV